MKDAVKLRETEISFLERISALPGESNESINFKRNRGRWVSSEESERKGGVMFTGIIEETGTLCEMKKVRVPRR